VGVTELTKAGKRLPPRLEGVFAGVSEMELVGEPLVQPCSKREREGFTVPQRSRVLVGRLAMGTARGRLFSGGGRELQHRRRVAGSFGVVRESGEVSSARGWRRKRVQRSSVESEPSVG
jgi:hypothetical protein